MNDLFRKPTEPIQVILMTRMFKMQGILHVPKIGKAHRQLSTALNGERRFLAMSQVQITRRTDNQVEPQIHSFIQVNSNAIEFIQPIESSLPEGRALPNQV